MNFVDELKKYKQASVVNLHDVLLKISISEKRIHVFFEGKTDESFYKRYLAEYFVNIHTYYAGNKKNVYELCKKLYLRKNKNNYFIFFVDKDIDELTSVSYPSYDCLNVTEYYSIENYLVCEGIYASIISELYKIGTGNELHNKLTDKFRQDFYLHVPCLLPIMAWVLFHRKKGNRPNLNNIKANSFISVDDDLNIKIHDIESMISDFDKNSEVVTDLSRWRTDKNDILNMLKSHKLKHVIRGKYELFLFVKYCSKVRDIIEKTQGEKVKCSFNLDMGNAIDILAPRLPMPPKIKEFLDANKSNYEKLVSN